MRVTRPLKYTGVTQEQFDRFKRAAKTEGLVVVNDSTDVMYDGISVKTVYDKDKQVLTITAYEPFWMAPGVVSGHFHELVTRALYRPEEIPDPNKPNDSRTSTDDQLEADGEGRGSLEAKRADLPGSGNKP